MTNSKPELMSHERREIQMMDRLEVNAERTLPADHTRAVLVGRAWVPEVGGPSVVAVRAGDVYDLSADFPTMRDLLSIAEPAAVVAAASGTKLGSLTELITNTPESDRDLRAPWLLAPIDLQPIKASGVTFAVSMIERVIEERAGGDPAAADGIRRGIVERIGLDAHEVRPGSAEAIELKDHLQAEGLWSQYLEVGIGPDAELFTKAPVLSSVGTAVRIGVLGKSRWSNSEPEVALAIDASGEVKGAMLANDMNLRDIEGRSALLLGAAKDNNASCAVGPFIRLFDDAFGIEEVRRMTVELHVSGRDGFELRDHSWMDLISRDPLDLVTQLMGAHHQYPDGVVLLLGTMFAPTTDRAVPGEGFTHLPGDVVRISAPELGCLANVVETSENCDPWTFGIGALMGNLAGRGLL